ncbi:MAG: alpha/beta hydrolase, partial [Pseudomonadota bacterium]
SFIRLIDFLHSLSAEDRCGQRIHLVAHSMGNYALRHALQHLRKIVNRARLPRIIDNVFLMAADEDADALEKEWKLGPLFEIARQVHVYHAADDRALIISDKTKFNPDRLGERGPKDLSSDIARVHVVDCGDVSDTKFTHGRHQYYRLVPEVIADVRAVLAGKRPDEIEGRHIVEPGRRYRIKKRKALRKKVGFPPE